MHAGYIGTHPREDRSWVTRAQRVCALAGLPLCIQVLPHVRIAIVQHSVHEGCSILQHLQAPAYHQLLQEHHGTNGTLGACAA
eukprot:scaffold1598_cov285-Prasinococcus_capsulatus_cf.AAC.3